MNNDVNGPFEILVVDTGGKFRTKAMPGAPCGVKVPVLTKLTK